MSADWIPSKDSDFKNFVTNLASVIGASPSDWGLSTAQVSELTQAANAWTSAYATTQSTQAALYAAILNQDLLRKSLESILRADCAIVQATEQVTDSHRALAGFPAVKAGSRIIVPIPKTAPVVAKIMIMGASLVVEYRDQAASSDSKAKPPGVREAEIWAKVGGPAPADGTHCAYIGSGSASPYLASFDAADRGKPCWFCLRWKNARGDHGPWGSVFATMVPGAA